GSRTKPPRPLLGPPTESPGRADPATTEPPRPLLGPPTAGPRLPDPRREGVRGTEPSRALLRPPTESPGRADPATKNARKARCTASVIRRWRARNARAADAGGPTRPTRRASRPSSSGADGSVWVWNSWRICSRCSTVRKCTYASESEEHTSEL